MQSETIGKLALALAHAQGQMSAATKDAKNPHFQSRYADLASVWDACRKELAAHEIAVVQIPTAVGAVVSVETRLLHASGEWIGGTLTVTGKDPGPQSVGSCITYLRRYGLAALVGVAPDDDDAEAAEGRAKVGTQAPRPAPAPYRKPDAPRPAPQPTRPLAPKEPIPVQSAKPAPALTADDIPF